MRFLISDAHDVYQSLPLTDNRYVCIRCGYRGNLHEMFHGVRCTPHFEKESSGWLPMEGTDYFET